MLRRSANFCRWWIRQKNVMDAVAVKYYSYCTFLGQHQPSLFFGHLLSHRNAPRSHWPDSSVGRINAVVRGVDHGGLGGGLTPGKYVGGVIACLDFPNMSHSFTQNRCWTTLQAPQHEEWKTCVKNERQNQFFEAAETVWWLGPTDPNGPPPWFYDRSTLLAVWFQLRFERATTSQRPTLRLACYILRPT